jgi:hypothetical protein
MTIRVENLFANLPELSGSEQLLSLFENPSVKIARIVSQSYSSPLVSGTIRMKTNG